MKKMKRILKSFIFIVFVLCVVTVSIFSYSIEVNAEDLITVKYNTSLISNVGKQGTNQCMAYTLAYCRTIIDGKVHSGSEYWKSGTGGMPSWANYYHTGSNDKQSFLRMIVASINQGKPVGMWVTKKYRSNQAWNASGNHWVAVIGYKSGADLANLKTSDFYIIDPGQCGYDYLSDNSDSFNFTTSNLLVYSGTDLTLNISSATFDSESISNVTMNSATLSTWVSASGTISEQGFYIGNNSNELSKKITNSEAVEWTRFHLEYDIRNYCGDLASGQQYYCQFYVVVGGTEYRGALQSFTTLNDQIAPSIDITYYPYRDRDKFKILVSASDNVGVTKVLFPTWYAETQTGENAHWIEGTLQPDGRWAATIDIGAWDYAEGTYITHTYVYDAAGNYSASASSIYMDRSAPVISNVQIRELTSNGYTVSCTVTDNEIVDKVVFPTWTDYNGHDDLVADWGSNPATQGTQSGNTYTYRVNISDHNYERGAYTTHIYAYDNVGNNCCAGIDVMVPPVAYILDVNPVINDTEYKSGLPGYTFNLTIHDENGNDVSGTYGATNVQDYYGEVPFGYTYTITPTGNLEGYTAVGCSGTIGAQINYAVPVWTRNSYTLDVNPMINGVDCGSGLNGYTFTLTMKDESGNDVSDTYGAVDVIDYYRTDIPYGYSYTITITGNVDGYATSGCNGLIKAEHNVAVPVWNIHKYTITYNANGGTNAPEAQVKEYGQSVKITSAKPTRTGYKLIGWNTQADGKGKTYKAGTVYKENADITLYAQWNIDSSYKNLITKASVSKIKAQNYTGREIRPEITVKLGKRELTAGTDYQIVYENNVQAGKATVTITGLGEYIGTKTVSFNIIGDSIKRAKVSGIEPKVYNGLEHTQNLSLQLGDITLTQDEDYTVSYAKNINAGTATVTITGINGYVGTIKKNFKISAYDISKDDQGKISGIPTPFTVVYEKGGCTPEVVPCFGGTELKKGKDYTISYANNKKVTPDNTKAMPTITVKGKGNYKGTVKVNFTIEAKNLNQVTATVADVNYSPKAGKYISKPILTDTNGKKLKAGADYTVAYSREDGTKLLSKSVVEPGTVIVVTITGKGYYTGTITRTYTVMESKAKQNAGNTTQSVDVSDGDAGTTDGNTRDVSNGDMPENNVSDGNISGGDSSDENPAAGPEAGQPAGGTVDGTDDAA